MEVKDWEKRKKIGSIQKAIQAGENLKNRQQDVQN